MAATILPKKHVGSINLSKNGRKTTEKLKTILKAVAKSSVLKTGLNMRKNRAYIYSELFLIKKSLEITPGLLGPKFLKIIACLSYAKNEILMYYNHMNQLEYLRKDIKKHYHMKTYVDTNVMKLLTIVIDLIHFIEKYLWIVVQYNTEYLILNDFNSLNNLYNSFNDINDKILPYVRTIVNPLHEFVIENEDKDNFSDETFSIIEYAINDMKYANKNIIVDDNEEKNENHFTILNSSNSALEDFRLSCERIITVLSIIDKNTDLNGNISINNENTVEKIVKENTTIENESSTFKERNKAIKRATENAKKTLILQEKASILYEQLNVQMLATYERTLHTSKNSLFALFKEFMIPFEILFFHDFCEETFTDSLFLRNFPVLIDSSVEINLNPKTSTFLNLNLSSIVNSNNDNSSQKDNYVNIENDNGMEYGIINDNINNYVFFILNSYNILNVHKNNETEEKYLNNVSMKNCKSMENYVKNYLNNQLNLLFLETEKLNSQLLQITTVNKIEYILSLKNVKNVKKSIFDFTSSTNNNNNDKLEKIVFNDNNSIGMFDRKNGTNKTEFKISHIFENIGEESKYIKKNKKREITVSTTIINLILIKKKILTLMIAAQNIIGIQIFQNYYNFNFTNFNCIIYYFHNSLRNIFHGSNEKQNLVQKNEIKTFGEKLFNFLSICQNMQYLFNFFKSSNFNEIFQYILFREINIKNISHNDESNNNNTNNNDDNNNNNDYNNYYYYYYYLFTQFFNAV